MVALFHLAYFAWHEVYRQISHSNSAASALPFPSGWVGALYFLRIVGVRDRVFGDWENSEAVCKELSLRLYPSAWICATITALFIFGDPRLADEYLRSVTLAPVGPWVDGVYWTLGVEIAFYSLVALVLVAAGGHRLTQVGLALA